MLRRLIRINPFTFLAAIYFFWAISLIWFGYSKAHWPLDLFFKHFLSTGVNALVMIAICAWLLTAFLNMYLPVENRFRLLRLPPRNAFITAVLLILPWQFFITSNRIVSDLVSSNYIRLIEQRDADLVLTLDILRPRLHKEEHGMVNALAARAYFWAGFDQHDYAGLNKSISPELKNYIKTTVAEIKTKKLNEKFSNTGESKNSISSSEAFSSQISQSKN